MKKILSLVLCLLMLLSSAVTFAAKPSVKESEGFSDLAPGHWAYKSVMEMVNKGILEGFEDGSFRPNDPVTRAQFAKILVSSLGLPLNQLENQTFADVPSKNWSFQYVQAAQKFLTGYRQNGQLYFRGEDVAVREDMAVAVVIAKGLNKQIADLGVLNSFSDQDNISQSLRNYIAIAVKNHIMDGYGDGFFGPQNTLTRAEAAELMYKSGILNGGGDKVVVGDDSDKVIVGEQDDNEVSTAPTVVSTDPANGGIFNPLTSNILITVSSEPQDVDTTKMEILHTNTGAKLAPISWVYENNQIVLRSRDSFNMSGGQKYKVTLYPGAIKYVNGSINSLYSFSFDTVSQVEDSATPTVVSTTPSNGATKIGLDSPILISFSRPISLVSFMNVDFLDGKGKGVQNFNVETYGDRIIKITHAEKLLPKAKYTVKVEANLVKDGDGNYNQPYELSFTTQEDTQRPIVINTNPADGAANIDSMLGWITVTFSEKVKSLKSSDISIVDDTGAAVKFNAKQYQEDGIAISPSLLMRGRRYTVTIKEGAIKDDYKNTNADYSFSFTIKSWNEQ